MPDRFDVCGQRRQCTKINPRFVRTVKIGAARSQQAVTGGNLGVVAILIDAVTAGHDLHRRAAMPLEFLDEFVEHEIGKFIASGMRYHCNAAGIADPGDRLL